MLECASRFSLNSCFGNSFSDSFSDSSSTRSRSCCHQQAPKHHHMAEQNTHHELDQEHQNHPQAIQREPQNSHDSVLFLKIDQEQQAKNNRPRTPVVSPPSVGRRVCHSPPFAHPAPLTPQLIPRGANSLAFETFFDAPFQWNRLRAGDAEMKM